MTSTLFQLQVDNENNFLIIKSRRIYSHFWMGENRLRSTRIESIWIAMAMLFFWQASLNIVTFDAIHHEHKRRMTELLFSLIVQKKSVDEIIITIHMQTILFFFFFSNGWWCLLNHIVLTDVRAKMSHGVSVHLFFFFIRVLNSSNFPATPSHYFH